jgi:cytochrome P450
MPDDWSWVFGHNIVILRYTKRLPRLANVILAMREPSQEFTDTEMFLLDLWSAYPSSIIVFNSDACTLVSQKWNLPRPPQSEVATRPIVGGPSLVSMNRSQWKTWRSLLNRGFRDSNIMHHVSFIVDCVGVFCERLKGCVGKDMVFLDDLASRLTFDVIMKVTLYVFDDLY